MGALVFKEQIPETFAKKQMKQRGLGGEEEKPSARTWRSKHRMNDRFCLCGSSLIKIKASKRKKHETEAGIDPNYKN